MSTNDTLAPAARFAWRAVRRDLRRQLRRFWLVVLLIALPVGLGSYVAIAQRSVMESSLTNAQLAGVGDADSIVYLPSYEPGLGVGPLVTAQEAQPLDPDTVAAALEDEADDVVIVQTFHEIRLPIDFDRIIAADWTGPLARGMFRSVDGRLPEAAGEIAVTADRLPELGVGLGDRFHTVGESEATVVGVVDPLINTGSGDPVYVPRIGHDPRLNAPAVIGVLGLDPEAAQQALDDAGVTSPDSSNIWIDDGRSVPTVYRDGLVDPGSRPEQAGTLITGALLVETALLASAAFLVAGQRRSTEIGRLTALGADPSHIKWMMLIEAAIVGLAGALIGAAAAITAASLHERSVMAVGRWTVGWSGRGTGLRINPWDLIMPMVVAVIAAVMAAWLPARRASKRAPRISVADAATQDDLPRHWGWLAPAFVAFAVVCLGLHDMLDDNQGGTLLDALNAAALLSLLGAVLALGAWMLAAMSGRGSRLPLGLRMGFRQIVRHRTRSVVVVGSAAVICGLSVAVVVLAASGVRGVLTDATLARVAQDSPLGEEWLDVGDLALPPARTSTASPLAVTAAHVDFDASARLAVAVDSEDVEAQVLYGDPALPDGAFTGHTLTIVTPELSEVLGIDNAIIEALAQPGTVVLTASSAAGSETIVRSGRVVAGYGPPTDGEGDEAAEVTLVSVPDRQLEGIGVGALIAPESLPSVLEVRDAGPWIVSSADGFTVSEQAWMTDSDTARLPYVDRGWYQNRNQQLIALAVATLLVLIVARIASALLAVESDRDINVMVSLGAPRWARQRLLGAQLGLLVAVGVVLAVPAGIGLAAAVTFEDDWSPTVVAVPAYLTVGLCLLPGLAAATVSLTSRSAAPALSRRLT